MTLRDIVVAFSIEIDLRSVRAAENAIKGVKIMASKLLGAIGIGLSIAGITNLAEAAADAEALKSQFSQVFGDLEQDASDKLDKIADETGVTVNRMKGSFTQIAAFAKTTGMEQADALDIADRSMKAVADSAAFYDRSIEDVTNSLQSFLKGNFENDAALGLSCTETTRNTAANALYGKSFKDLSEAEKQLTLLQMVEDANKASGAIGQAARESDTWTNQLGNLKQNVQDLKAAAGNAFLKPAVMVLKLLNSLVSKATVGMKKLTSETGILTKAFNGMHALVKRLKPAIDRMMQTLQIGAKKGMGMVKNVIDKLGGVDNALKLLAIIAGAFFIVMNWNKIIPGAKTFTILLNKMKGLFSLANLKTLAIVAAVVLLALIVEDFINFLMGNDSVIGTIFDKAGIGADNAREAIFKAWQKVKEFLLNVWDFLKQAAGMWVDTVKGFFERHGESIKANFMRVWGIISSFLDGVWTFLTQLAATLFGGTEDSISDSQESTKDKILSIWQAILDALSVIWDAIFEVVNTVFDAIATVIEVVFKWIQKFWNRWGSRIMTWFKALWDSLGGILNGFLDIIKGVANFISSVFKGDWKGAWEAVKQVFIGVWEVIVNFFSAVWEKIKIVFEMALSALKALWETIWNGIESFFEGIWNGIVGFFQGVINTIMNVISPIAEFFTTVFQNAWDGICSAFSGIAPFFQGIWDRIVGIFKAIGVAIADAVSGAVKGAINAVLSGAAGIINGFIRAINFAIGIINAIPGVSISKLNELSVPQLAEGGIATSATKAIVGEGAEPEAIMPLSKLAAMINKYIRYSHNDEDSQLVTGYVKGAIGKIYDILAKITDASKVSHKTSLTNSTKNSTTNITQNNTFNNSYSGNDVQAQQNVSKGMKQSAQDATSYMAKGLAYAR